MHSQNWIVLLAAGLLFSLPADTVNAQCATFDSAENGQEAKEAHVVYRDFLKGQDYEKAYEYWQQAFSIAPAADGGRIMQYMDGVTLLKHQYDNSSDEAEKLMLRDQILDIFDQIPVCYPDDKAFALGRKVYHMYYSFNMPRAQIYQEGKKAIEEGGNKTEYVALIPTADGLVTEYEAGNVEVGEAREIFQKLQDIANYNIEKNDSYNAQYNQALQGMNGILQSIESNIFDCQYFKDKYKDMYNADPDNPEVYREVYKKLVQGGCDKEDPLIKEISEKDAARIAEEKAQRLEEKRKNNPGWYASELYKEGKYPEAIKKYKEAINKAEDDEKKASYYFSIASIQFRKLKKYGTARRNARKAAELNSGWGRPYMLIADMYASTASGCGDPWNQRLAILAAVEKYKYAKSIDSEVVAEANDRISKYRSSYPDENEGFMRGVKAGQSAKVGCWIGETVTVRFK